MLRSPRCLGNKRKACVIGERIDSRRFSGIRAPGKRDFAFGIGRQITQIGDGCMKNRLLE
jgi:hypothetical protein